MAANTDAESGTVVAEPTGNTFGVSGVGKAKGRSDGDSELLTRAAARDAAYNVMEVLSGVTATEYDLNSNKSKKRSKKWRWAAILLVVGGLVAVTAGGGSNKRQPVDSRVPTRLSVRATTDGIRLTWVRPLSTDPVFAYQIQRSANGTNFVRIDDDKAGGDSVQFTDFNINPGTAYVYQIRVLYTSGHTTDWVEFNQIVAP